MIWFDMQWHCKDRYDVQKCNQNWIVIGSETIHNGGKWYVKFHFISFYFFWMCYSHYYNPRVKKHFLCFHLFFELISDNLTTIKVERLSHINALCINLSYSLKDQSLKFLQKSIENWRSWKSQFFLSQPFLLFFWFIPF